MLSPLLSLCALLLSSAVASDLHKNQICFDTCYEANGYVLYAGDDPESYYYSACRYPQKVLSIYAAATVYCTQEEIRAGALKLQEYCEEYGPDLDLLPISDFASNLTSAALKQLPVVSYDEASSAAEPYNYSIMISQDFFESMHKTVVTWEFELWTHTTYGFAMYGFWGAVLLLGIFKNIHDVFVHQRFEHYTGDMENLARSTAPRNGVYRTAYGLVKRKLLLAFTFGNHHQRKLWGSTIPTRMTAAVVSTYWIINLVLCSVNIKAYLGNLYYPQIHLQALRYVADRTGIICFANLPLLWMFAGRNNIFLWATGWKFSTFNIFHRHVARIATIEAIVHSATYTALYFAEGKAYYFLEFKELWFVMGVVGTVLMSFILIFSSVIVRKMTYELFLTLHIAMSIAVIIVLFHHVSVFDGEYDAYLWALVAIWPFDRLLRIVRLGYCNLHIHRRGRVIGSSRATVAYDEASGIVTLKVIPGATYLLPRPGQHYFIYTPSTWKFWESHPFTLGAWTSSGTHGARDSPNASFKQPGSTVTAVEHESGTETSSLDSDNATSKDETRKELVFWIRPFDGFTKRLMKHSPYGHREPIHHFESVLLIGGGTGVAGVYPYLEDHLHRVQSGRPTRTRTIKLVVAARQVAFFRQLAIELLRSLPEGSGGQIELYATRDDESHVRDIAEATFPTSGASSNGTSDDVVLDDKKQPRSEVRMVNQVRIGRPDIQDLILSFARAHHNPGTHESIAVMVCGPGGMADEARAAVLKAGNEEIDVEYFEDAFAW